MENQKPEQVFNRIEIKIISEYLEGSSMRKLADTYKSKGFGRTRIKNLLDRYAKTFPEESERINNQMKENKYHKNDGESVELADITDEQIMQAYDDIQNNGITLTAVSKSLGRTKEYVKKRVLEYIDNLEEEKVFLDTLKANQHKKRKDDFILLSEQEKKEYIFKKLNRRRALNDRPEYDISFLERKYERLRRYMLDIRNQNVPEKAKLSENDFFKILYDTPTLLSSSLTNRIVPALENLDYHKYIGMENASKIIREDASVLCSSIARTNIQIKVLKENDLLTTCLEKPRNFRTSPEMLYGLIEYHKTRVESNKEDKDIFITKSKLESKYGLTPDQLTERFNIRKEYGDDEYFK